MFLLNAFSVNMLAGNATVRFTELAAEEAANLLTRNFVSAVGHADTAAVFSSILKMPVQAARVTVTLAKHDLAILGQYSGPRLPEGSTTLPEGATIRWYLVQTGT